MSKKSKDKIWPSGVLTDGIIEKDIRNSSFVKALALTVGAILLAVMAWPSLMATSDMDLKTISLLAGVAILAIMAGKSWMAATAKLEYRIEEDKITSKEMKEIYEDKDAELTGMSTRVPVLNLEKHGPYRLNADQCNRAYREYELYHELKEGEDLYIVYSKRTDNLLYIYRQKYWKLP